jgi:MraZ protein
MLLGEYRLRLEGAGWLVIPASIRNALHELYAPDDTTLILSTFFEKCICCYPVAEWYKEPERLPLLGVSSREIKGFFTSAALCPLDRKGRVYLPRLYCEHAEIERDVLLIGQVCHLELC